MSDETRNTDDRHEPGARRRRFHGSRGVRFGVAAVALATLGAVAATAFDAGAHGRFGWGERHSALTVDAVRERAVDKAEWLLDAIDADQEQRAQINETVEGLVDTLHPWLRQHRDNRRELVAELTRPSPDPAAMEALRAAELELLDQVSREVVGALARMSTVLTPEQRIELADRLGRFRHHH